MAPAVKTSLYSPTRSKGKQVLLFPGMSLYPGGYGEDAISSEEIFYPQSIFPGNALRDKFRSVFLDGIYIQPS